MNRYQGQVRGNSPSTSQLLVGTPASEDGSQATNRTGPAPINAEQENGTTMKRLEPLNFQILGVQFLS